DANGDTLSALRATGISFDCSVNPAYGHGCSRIAGRPLLSPARIQDVVEFPMTTFPSFHGGLRPLQVCACSSREMPSALLKAWREQWPSATILLHSFELIQRPSVPGQFGRAAPIRRRRFEKLCDFLGRNRDKFRTRTFSELKASAAPYVRPVDPGRPLRVPFRQTLRRYVEQAADRLVTPALLERC